MADRPARRRLVRINRTEEEALYRLTRLRRSTWARRLATRISRWLYGWAAR